MAKQSAIEQDGTIVESFSNAMFRVELENGVRLCAYLRKMRMHYIKILPGDKVKSGYEPYDLQKAESFSDTNNRNIRYEDKSIIKNVHLTAKSFVKGRLFVINKEEP